MVDGFLDRQDGVAVVAVPLHSLAVEIAGALYCDKLPVLQFGDVFHHRVHGQPHSGGDGVVTGMALMAAAVFAVEQVGVDGDRAMPQVQGKDFVREGEKLSCVFATEYRNHLRRDQISFDQSIQLLFCHVWTHVEQRCNLIHTWNGATPMVAVEIAEIGEDTEGGGRKFQPPNFVGQ